jgi:hypothetical protein
MKKALFVLFVFIMSSSAFAEDWFLSGAINLDFSRWEAEPISNQASPGSGDSTTAGFSVGGGKYVIDDFVAVGIDTSFSINDEGNWFRVGPFARFDVRISDNIGFSIKGMIAYTSFDNSYEFDQNYKHDDANRISILFSPFIIYSVNDNLELFYKFMDMGYSHTWVTHDKWDYTINRFIFIGPYTAPLFGINVKF